MAQQTEKIVLATAESVLKLYSTDKVNQQENAKKYFEAMRIRRELGFGARKTSRMINASEGAVSNWLSGESPRSVKGLRELERAGLLPLIVSEDASFTQFVRTLGLRYADGCIYHQKRNNSFTCYLCFGDRQDAVKLARDCLDFWGLDLPISKGATAYNVYLPASFARLMISVGSPVGDKVTQNFRLPKWIFGLSDRLKFVFLDGLFSGDGEAPRLKKGCFSLESLKLSLSAEENTAISFCGGFMTDIYDLLSSLQINTSKPTIGWNSPRISKTGVKTHPIVVRVLTQKPNMLRFLENVPYTYCSRTHAKITAALAVLCGDAQRKMLHEYFSHPQTSSPAQSILSVMLDEATQKTLIENAAENIAKPLKASNKYALLSRKLIENCESLKLVKLKSVRDRYLPRWKSHKMFIPLDCLVFLSTACGKNLDDVFPAIDMVKQFRAHNNFAVPCSVQLVY